MLKGVSPIDFLGVVLTSHRTFSNSAGHFPPNALPLFLIRQLILCLGVSDKCATILDPKFFYEHFISHLTNYEPLSLSKMVGTPHFIIILDVRNLMSWNFVVHDNAFTMTHFEK